MLTDFAKWLSHTAISGGIRDISWAIPLTQTIHILAIAVVLSSVGVLALRIFGVMDVEDRLSQTASRYLPPLWAALGVLAASGVVLVIGEPERSLPNSTFQLKMALLVAAIGLTVAFRQTVARRPTLDRTDRGAVGLRLLAAVTLLLWLAIPVAGRWIAYTIVETGY